MKLLIIGAGPAGVTVAETFRQFDTRSLIIMLSSEPYPPYSPPAMIEYFQTGKEIHFWKGVDFPAQLGLEYRSGAQVVAISPEQRTVQLADGGMLAYDKLVIAAGSRLYAPVRGADKPGIYNFKSLSAAEAMMHQVRKGNAHHAIIVGAGFIGVEIALLLRSLGIEVTQIEMKDRVMPRVLDAETGAIVLEVMRQRGINVKLNTKAAAFLGEPQAHTVELESGQVLAGDLLVAATGVKPNIEFLKDSGIKTNWGVLVDDQLRTNLPDIYAAGDVAETFDRFTGEQYVHAIFPNAVGQAQIVAHNLLGENLPYQGAESMNSLKHLGLPVIVVGQMEGEELRIRQGNTLRKLYLQDNRIAGFCLTGDLKVAGIYRALMNKQVNVARFKDRLLKPGFGMGFIQGAALSTQFMT